MNRDFDTCGCCDGVEAVTPVSVENAPGLSALAYRVGTHATFRESMQAALGKRPVLSKLTTRADDDPTMAVIDAWSTVLDVLTFYQERIANEGYLRTAIERRSVLELARSIGYELRPGVAASTWLAFTLESVPGAPEQVTIVEGTKTQSVPGQDERPQTFETIEEIVGKGVWNGLTPRISEPQSIARGSRTIWLAGTALNLQPGDPLLLIGSDRKSDVGSDNWEVRFVGAVEINRDMGMTEVTLDRAVEGFNPDVDGAWEYVEAHALRRRASIFGHNAPDWDTMPKEVRDRYMGVDDGRERIAEGAASSAPSDWPGLTLSEIAEPEEIESLQLDTVYSKIVRGSWVVLSTPDAHELYGVEEVTEDSRSRFGISSKTTRVVLSGENLEELFDNKVRQLTVFAESELLDLAEQPITTYVELDSVVLSEAVEGLEEGRLLAISGIDEDGEERSEVVELAETESVDDLTELVFTTDLAFRYVRDTVTINANVARATHGETKTEILGHGDGSKSFQKFLLKNNPLTYVSAPTAGGAESTLEVRVDGVLWDETSTLYGAAPADRVYTIRLADDGTTTVRFGDGETGSRLPTGSENVTAAYRAGIGMEGMVRAGQISLLMTRALGLKKVVNPLEASGAADPEELDDARENAPLTVLTLDRIVSLRDFEDFSRAFAGIGKAMAVEMWDGERRLVHVTIAASDGGDVEEGTATWKNLLAGIDGARHPDRPVLLGSFESLTFDLKASILVDERYIPGDVIANVKSALEETFSFEGRRFAQSVTASEVIAAMQRIEGVTAVDLDELFLTGPETGPLNMRLAAFPARWSGSEISPAQLLTINAHGINLTEMGS